MTMHRVVMDELLDHLAPNDTSAMRSRRDLLRLHRAMRTRQIVAQGWRALGLPPHGGPPLRVLEIGAGDGRLLLAVAQALAPTCPPVHLTLLDRQSLVSLATRAAFADLGWTT